MDRLGGGTLSVTRFTDNNDDPPGGRVGRARNIITRHLFYLCLRGNYDLQQKFYMAWS